MLKTLVAEANTITSKAVDEALRVTGGKLLTEVAATSPLRDPGIVASYDSVLAADAERKLRNRAAVFGKAADLLTSGTIASDDYAAAPGDDWLNAFQRFSEDASSARLQDVLARILAGEINRSGSYAIATVRAVSEIDTFTSDCFSEINAEAFDKLHIYRSEKYSTYPWWDKINTLRDAGMISVSEGSIHNPSVHLGAPDGIGYWSIGAEPAIMIRFRDREKSEIPVFKMTKLGIEIATLLPPPDFERNLRLMVADNPHKSGWIEVNLLIGGQIAESIYAA
jgi:hypothetical protein